MIKDLRCQQYIEHHLAHIASAYFISAWEKAAGFSIDGSGDFVTCIMAACEGNRIEPKKRIYVPHSLGSLYTMICEFIGYSQYGDEGKVMGLSALGTDTYRQIFQDMIVLKSNFASISSTSFPSVQIRVDIASTDKWRCPSLLEYVTKLFSPPQEPHMEITSRTWTSPPACSICSRRCISIC
jgi:carbamoyltransferase